MIELTAEQKARGNLLHFARYFWPQFLTGNHHRLIVSRLHALERGDIQRLIICMPPRHGKSKLASEFFPAWWLGRNPSHKVICASSAKPFARRWGRSVRNTLRDPRFQKVFPGVTLSNSSAAADSFQVLRSGSLDEPGEYNGLGVSGGSGLGAHLFLLDDPVKDAEQADSEAFKEKFRDWYTSTAETRLSPDGRVVLIQTRWREDDPAGWFQREFTDAGWELLSLPAVSEDREEWTLPGGGKWVREKGEALWPERWPLKKLEARRDFLMKHGYGRDWWALYQQRPAPAEGTRVKWAWFGVYDSPPERLAGHAWRVVMSVDSARGDKDINDPSVVGVWAQTRTGHYLLDVWRDRVRYPQLKLQIEAMARRWQPSAILIEKASSGIELLQDLAKESCLPCIECSPAGKSKEVRLDAAAPAIEAGRVHLPHAALWLPEFKREIITFPNGEHDDQVDMMSQYLNWSRAAAPQQLPAELGEAGAEALSGLRSVINDAFGSGQGLGI